MIIDRIKFAADLSRGKKVLDIGGVKMAGTDQKSPFAIAYGNIEKSSAEYAIVDFQKVDCVDWVVDFNKPESIPEIRRIIKEFQPDVILCMELLEHVNYHFELMNELAIGVGAGAELFITLPNNGNLLLNLLNWNSDHVVSFLKETAKRFIERSDLGRYTITEHSCVGMYRWDWIFAYFLGLFKPWSWGFYITNSRK